jgi:hypothetical protein
VKVLDLRLTGYPILRERLRFEFRRHRSAKRVCGCGKCLNHLDTNWFAVRTPDGVHIADHVCCNSCVPAEAKILINRMESPLTTEEYDTIFLVLIRGTELFI